MCNLNLDIFSWAGFGYLWQDFSIKILRNNKVKANSDNVVEQKMFLGLTIEGRGRSSVLNLIILLRYMCVITIEVHLYNG